MLRCFDLTDIDDDDVLASVRATFPRLTGAFVITDKELGATPGSGLTVFNQSIRMSADLPLAHPPGGENES